MATAADSWTIPGHVAPLPLRRMQQSGSTRLQPGVLFIPGLATLLRAASSRTAPFGYALVALYALVGRRQAVVALFLCWLFNLLNHELGGGPPKGAAILRHVIYAAAFGGAVLHGRSPLARTRSLGLTLFTLAIGGLILVHSLIVSPVVDVSVLKIVAFTTVITALVLAWSGMGPAERQLTERMVFGGLAAVAVCSIPLTVIGPGYARFPGLFQGILIHPQNFGPTMAVLAGALAAQWLTTRKLSAWATALLAVSLFLMYLSKSRIALFAFVGGLGLAFIIDLAIGAALRFRSAPRIVKGRVGIATAGLIVVLMLGSARLIEFYNDFLRKGGQEVGSLTEAAFKSRGFLIDIMSANIREKPLTGIGFGIGSNPEDVSRIARDPVLGLPIMATIEKGVMPYAVVEELGIPLAVLVFLWLGYLGLRAARGGLVPLTVYSIVMLTNLAESMFFSPGGQGMLVLIMVTWAATTPDSGSRLMQPRPAALPAAAA